MWYRTTQKDKKYGPRSIVPSSYSKFSLTVTYNMKWVAHKKMHTDSSSYMIQKRTFTYKGKYMVITFAKFVYESPTKLSEK